MSDFSLVSEVAANIRKAKAGVATTAAPASGPEEFNPAVHAVDRAGKPIPIKGGGFRKRPVFKTAPPSSAHSPTPAPAAPAADLPPGSPVFTPAAALPPPAPAAPEPPKVAPEVAARRFLKLARMFLKGPLSLTMAEENEWEVALTEKFTDDGSPAFRSGLVLWFLSGCYLFDRWEALQARFTGKKATPKVVSETNQPEEAEPAPRRETVERQDIPSVLTRPSSIS